MPCSAPQQARQLKHTLGAQAVGCRPHSAPQQACHTAHPLGVNAVDDAVQHKASGRQQPVHAPAAQPGLDLLRVPGRHLRGVQWRHTVTPSFSPPQVEPSFSSNTRAGVTEGCAVEAHGHPLIFIEHEAGGTEGCAVEASGRPLPTLNTGAIGRARAVGAWGLGPKEHRGLCLGRHSTKKGGWRAFWRGRSMGGPRRPVLPWLYRGARSPWWRQRSLTAAQLAPSH